MHSDANVPSSEACLQLSMSYSAKSEHASAPAVTVSKQFTHLSADCVQLQSPRDTMRQDIVEHAACT